MGMYISAISEVYWEHTLTVAVIPHTTLYVPTHSFTYPKSLKKWVTRCTCSAQMLHADQNAGHMT